MQIGFKQNNWVLVISKSKKINKVNYYYFADFNKYLIMLTNNFKRKLWMPYMSAASSQAKLWSVNNNCIISVCLPAGHTAVSLVLLLPQ